VKLARGYAPAHLNSMNGRHQAAHPTLSSVLRSSTQYIPRNGPAVTRISAPASPSRSTKSCATRCDPGPSLTGALEQHLLNFQVEVRTALSDVALHVKRLQMDTQSLYKTLASVSDLGDSTVRRYSSGNLHCRAQAVSGVQSVTVPADSSTEVHTKLDDLSSLVKSSHEASRKSLLRQCIQSRISY